MAKRVLLVAVLTGLICPAAVRAAEWRVPGDFATIQAAIDSEAVVAGDTILVGPGSHAGAVVKKQVEIKGEDGAVISTGPLHGSGLVMGFLFDAGGAGGGATISHLRFEGVDLAVFSRGASEVTVSHNVFISPVQGVSNWMGAGWDISNNEFIDLRARNGGGIAILIGDRTGGTVAHDNVVAHNKILGALSCGTDEGGGYNGTGIVLYSDFRYGSSGGEVSFNRVLKNKVGLVSSCALVDVVALELTDTSEAASLSMIHDNAIGFNDFRGTAIQVALTPEALDTVNAISRNLGENRGHGLHPRAFGPQ